MTVDVPKTVRIGYDSLFQAASPQPFSRMYKHLIILTCLASLFLTACVYKIDVAQGNIVTQEMVNALRPRMNQRQVRFVMGTPMLVDVFHPERWDYIYSFKAGDEPRVQSRITLLFKDELLAGIQGDFRPSTVLIDEEQADEMVIVPKREIKKSLWQKIVGLFSWSDDENEQSTEPVTESQPTESVEEAADEPSAMIDNDNEADSSTATNADENTSPEQ